MTKEAQKKNYGSIMILLAAMLWGTTGTAQALAPMGASPLVVGSLRLAVGSAFLLFFARSQRVNFEPNLWLCWPSLLAGICVALYQFCFFAGVKKTGVAVGTIVAIGSGPVFAGLLTYLFRGEQLTRTWIISTFLAVVGCALLIGTKQGLTINIWGILLALGAGFAYALYALISKNLLQTHAPEAVMAVIFTLGFIFTLPVLKFLNWSWFCQIKTILVILHLGILATGLAYILFARGLTTVPVSSAVTLSLAEPLTAGLLGIFFLGEPLSLYTSIGISCILISLVLISRTT